MIFPCGECQEIYDGWLEYKRPASGWIQYPLNAERSAESRAAQIAGTWALIRQQCDGVVESCRRKGCLDRPGAGA